MIKVILVDDEILNLAYLKSILEKVEEFKILGCFTEPFKAIDFISRNHIDIVFLDIELPDINGIDCALTMQNIQNDIKIVFITAYSQYAVEAFKVHAIHYLLKPIKFDQVIDLLNYFKSLKNIELNINNEFTKTSVFFFGKFRITNSLNEEVKWPTKKTAELCAYFILHANQRLHKYRICEDLWPDIDEDKSSKNFHVTLYRLRQLLTTYGLSIRINSFKGSNEGYICEVKNISSDLDEYISQLSLNNIDTLSKMTGGFLEFNYYIWSEQIQNQVNSEIINKIHHIVREFEYTNRKNSINLIQQSLKIYKTDESLMMHYFNLLLRENQIYQIIHEFEKYKKILKDEYDLHPSIELSTFVKKVI